MTHVSEQEFHHVVEQFLRDTFTSADAIESKVWLEESGRYADFLVRYELPTDDPPVVYAVEVENDFESVGTGLSQAELYAAHFDQAIPVVCIPDGHIEQPEYDYLRSQYPHTIFFQIDPEY